METFEGLIKVGEVHSPYRDPGDAPSQGRHRNDESTLEIFGEYEEALLDVEKCSHLIVLYWQDRGDRGVLRTRTPWGPDVHGVFATRSPNRPNPIGICLVELVERRGRVLRVRGMDALDGSPLLDIKPYFQGIDSHDGNSRTWRDRRHREQDG